jgi:hypothetical protein
VLNVLEVVYVFNACHMFGREVSGSSLGIDMWTAVRHPIILRFISQHVQLVTAYQEIPIFRASGTGWQKIHACWGFSISRIIPYIPQ